MRDVMASAGNEKVQELLVRASQDLEAGRIDSAKWTLQRLLAKDPRNADALHMSALISAQEGNLQQAVTQFQQAIAAAPNDPRHHYNFAVLLASIGQTDAAMAEYRATLAIDSRQVSAHNNLGNALRQQGKLSEALHHLNEAIKYNPQHAGAHSNRGTVLADLGRLDESVRSFRASMSANPNQVTAHSNLLLNLTAFEQYDAAMLFREHQYFGQVQADRIAASVRQPTVRLRERSATDRLRIGYVSADFRAHSVAFFIDPILAAHDRTRFEVFAYSSVRSPDAVTGMIKQRVEHWRDISNLPDERADQMIRNDRIDVLVDLGGHTRDSRLILFARRPAPVQIEYLGYPGTSGMRQMDYLITDARIAPPPESDGFYTERVIRLPRTFFCYGPPDFSPEVDELPARRNGHIRFGVFTNPIKIRPMLIELWANILHHVPNSRLVIQSNALQDEGLRNEVLMNFGISGIDDARIELKGWSDFREYLSTLRSVDITLDTFPFNGHTTTCHALWMGVPVVTHAGQTHASRMGLSICESIGLSDLVASGADDYVNKATALAEDENRLSDLRASMRRRMTEAGLCDRERFTRELEGVYQQMLALKDESEK